MSRHMPLFRRVLLYLDVIQRLGFLNVAYVVWYRFSIKCGIRKLFFPQRRFLPGGPFFHPTHPVRDYPEVWKSSLRRDAEQICQGAIRYYAHHWKFVGDPPNWFLNPFNGRFWLHPHQHWTTLDDFHAGIGDIKNIWEASRFEWVVTLARAYAVSGAGVYLDTLNRWLSDWVEKNPVNKGPNWKCGQEASIRIFNLLLAAAILKQWQHPSPVLREFVCRHLERIHANIRYAIAQNNNHGTSETAALFIGGHWLSGTCSKDLKSRDSHERELSGNGNNVGRVADDKLRRYNHFARQGRKWLENRLEKLVEEDGSFSQHSVTYHRVLLDTLIFAEYWRKKLGADPFSATFYQRATAALDWLIMLADPQTGNAPNLGANDGAMLLHLHACDYRDFRPSIQTAAVLFAGRKQYAAGPWDEPLYWLGLNGVVPAPEAPTSNAPTTGLLPSNPPVLSYTAAATVSRRNGQPPKNDAATALAGADNRLSESWQKISKVLPGGYVIMAGRRSWAMLRFPMFRFRPGHNDVFHFDLWLNGKNICPDGGSYSYNPDVPAEGEYFSSVSAHNTASFDEAEQMPRLGRFMLGQWIRAEQVGAIEQAGDGAQHWTGSYRDYRGNRHQRKITWKEDTWIIEDELAGRFEDAKVVYRLIPDDYQIEGSSVAASWGRIDVAGEDLKMALSEGFESLYYWQKQPLPVLVLRVGKDVKKITTRFSLTS